MKKISEGYAARHFTPPKVIGMTTEQWVAFINAVAPAVIAAVISIVVLTVTLTVESRRRRRQELAEARDRSFVALLGAIDRQMELVRTQRATARDKWPLTRTLWEFVWTLPKRDAIVGEWLAAALAHATSDLPTNSSDKTWVAADRFSAIVGNLNGWRTGDVKLRWFERDRNRLTMLTKYAESADTEAR